MAAEETDDLEYYVTFPAPKPGDDQKSDDYNVVENMLRERETAVMVIGWMGSQDKHLAKYSEIYERVGCTTVRYNTTTDDVFGGKKRHQEVAQKLLEVLIEMNLSDNPVLFHIFSNGGCRIYNAMRYQLKENEAFEEIDHLGVVYDSAPGKCNPHQKASLRALNHDGIWQIFTYFGTFVFASIVAGLDSLYNLLGWESKFSEFSELLYAQDGCPELYLFSKADKLIPASDVEDMIERRRMQGVDITFECWEDSPHVQHMRVHRESYMSRCYEFLTKCIKVSNGEDTD